MKRLLIACFLLVAFSLTATSQTRKIIVSQDGRGDYATVQAAIDAVPDSSISETIIYIKNGVYKEKLRLPETKNESAFRRGKRR